MGCEGGWVYCVDLSEIGSSGHLSFSSAYAVMLSGGYSRDGSFVYGTSSGTVSIDQPVHVSALSYLRAENIEHFHVIAVGYSFGCFALYSLSTLRPLYVSNYEGIIINDHV